MVDVEGFAKPARESGGTDQVADPAAFGGLFPSAEDEVATARMITARGEHIDESPKSGPMRSGGCVTDLSLG